MLAARPVVFSLALAASTWTLCAAAQGNDPATRAAGRKLAQDGVALLQQGQPQPASDKLEKAYQLLPVPSIALWSGRALAARGLLVEASERFGEAVRMTDLKGDLQVQHDAQKESARELERLAPRIPTLVIAVAMTAGERPTVTLDGKPVPTALWGEEQPVNPGVHELTLVSGSQQIKRQVTLAEAEKKRESLALDASSKAAPVTSSAADTPAHGGGRRTLAFVALAAGGAGLVVGGVTGGLALSKRSSLEDSGKCSGDVCLRSAQSDVDSLDTMRTISTVGFITGGVFAAAGLVLLFTDRSSTDAPRIAVSITPSHVAIAGAF